MAIYYHCRHCGVKLGEIDSLMTETEKLGFHKLNDEERQEMITYDQTNGNIYVKTICEDCQELLERYPEFHQQDYLIH
ncbi:anti-sigma-F factor Fin family protein [Bacillaceae bacterium Marseille-Q3522]|nr:anti-sigma-F factor Fin family protein [Bacillaceae bacterium Marseille-Q3522]